MSSWKKAAKCFQKTHYERHQPKSRQHLGILEKRKDYITRAKDYHEKQETLKLLRKRALNKNPDEFYFHMINSKVSNGIHKERSKTKKHTPEQIKLMETQDLKYISYRRNIEAKKVKKMQSQLHMIDMVDETQNKHIFFVENKDEEIKFDISQRLNIHPSLLERKTNRPTLDMLKKIKLPDLDEQTVAKIEQRKHMSYKELEKRCERERQLMIVQQKMETSNALKDKTVPKPKQICSGSKDGAPVYQWKYQRKR